MKQSKINSYFSPGDLKHGASGSALHYRQMNSSDKMSSRGLFYNSKDPTVIYEEIRKREKQQFKYSNADHMGLESDLSSQNSSQMMLNSQLLNSQNSQSFAGNSSYSDDGFAWYQQWINKPQNTGLCRPQSRCSSRQSYTGSNTHSQDFKQYMENAKKKSREKEEKDMLSSFLALVKECCEETKNNVALNSGKFETQIVEGFSSSLAKMEEMMKKLSGVENLLKERTEYEDKITRLENDLREKSLELDKVRRECEEYRTELDNKIIDKLTEAFDKGQQMQSDKIEELVSNTTQIKSFLNKPKIQTADMWCQYSPRLPLLNPNQKLLPSISTQTSSSGSSQSLTGNKNNFISNSKNNDAKAQVEPTNSIMDTSMSIAPLMQSVPCNYNLINHRCLPPPPSYSELTDPSPFVVPSILPPRHPNSGFNKQRSMSDLSMGMIPPAISYPSHPLHRSMPNPASMVQLSTSVNGSPFGNIGYPWNKNKSSPIATVVPQQHLIQNTSQMHVQEDINSTSSISQPHRHTWQEIAENQSQEWFSRPNTRSSRRISEVHQPINQSNIPSSSTSVVTLEPHTGESTLTDNLAPAVKSKKPKVTRRKRQCLTRKKGKSKRKSTMMYEPNTVKDEGSASDVDIQISWADGNTGISHLSNAVEVRRTPQAILKDKTNNNYPSSTSIHLENIKQENQGIINNSFPVRRQAPPSSSWIILSDSEDESAANDDVYSFSQEIKENQPFRKSFSMSNPGKN